MNKIKKMISVRTEECYSKNHSENSNIKYYMTIEKDRSGYKTFIEENFDESVKVEFRRAENNPNDQLQFVVEKTTKAGRRFLTCFSIPEEMAEIFLKTLQG